jgi:hypothetical protein
MIYSSLNRFFTSNLRPGLDSKPSRYSKAGGRRRQWARAQRPGGNGVRGGIPVKGRAQDLVLILITRLQAAEGIRVSVKTTPRMK